MPFCLGCWWWWCCCRRRHRLPAGLPLVQGVPPHVTPGDAVVPGRAMQLKVGGWVAAWQPGCGSRWQGGLAAPPPPLLPPPYPTSVLPCPSSHVIAGLDAAGRWQQRAAVLTANNLGPSRTVRCAVPADRQLRGLLRPLCFWQAANEPFSHPTQLPNHPTTMVQEFQLADSCKTWFVRFASDYRWGVLACGNARGKVFVWAPLAAGPGPAGSTPAKAKLASPHTKAVVRGCGRGQQCAAGDSAWVQKRRGGGRGTACAHARVRVHARNHHVCMRGKGAAGWEQETGHGAQAWTGRGTSHPAHVCRVRTAHSLDEDPPPSAHTHTRARTRATRGRARRCGRRL